MRFTVNFFIIVAILLLFNSCIKQVSLNYREPAPLLVVEGLLLTDSTPCKVTLSYSGLFNKAGAQQLNYIDNATVTVEDDMGNKYPLNLADSGVYVSAGNWQALVGHSYSVDITLANGKKYASYPEKIVPVQKKLSLDTVDETTMQRPEGLYGGVVEIRTQDPPAEKNYYRWISVDYISRISMASCGFNQPPCTYYCYQAYSDPNIYVLSDDLINGSEIRYQPALISPYYYYGNHYIDIKQLSLTKEAYEFWRLYGEQTTRTGGILDPLPAPIQGNIHCLTDSTELALGYFEASDVGSFKFVMSPAFINAYITFFNTPQYVSHDGLCEDVYPNTLKNAPPGWENAPNYIVKVY
ncbi:MAG TPA: DUF4249 domain-containing protein [Chitinophagaceae bacterium]|nr:DUF4249 domain-containing protein [Chitinophagaceae bacterium]